MPDNKKDAWIVVLIVGIFTAVGLVPLAVYFACGWSFNCKKKKENIILGL